jgi:hypothetical protein
MVLHDRPHHDDMYSRVDALVDRVFALPHDPQNMLAGARAAARALGLHPAPVARRRGGPGLVATGVPRGRSATTPGALAGAAIAMVCAARRGAPAMLELTWALGDREASTRAQAYLSGLCRVSERMRTLHGVSLHRTLAFGLAPTGALTGEQVVRLEHAGVVVRQVGVRGPLGALVHPFARVDELTGSSPGKGFAFCLAQTDPGTSCAECGLCFERPELAVVFDPERDRGELAELSLGWLLERV